jgi:hypothetical protein
MALCKGTPERRFCTNPVLNDGMMCDRCWNEMHSEEPEPVMVYVLVESEVFHRDKRCRALRRQDRYHIPREVPIEDARSLYRPCRYCATELKRA